MLSLIRVAEAQDKGMRNAMLVNLGFAMIALLVEGTIAHGNRRMAGHIGHMANDNKSSACSCGRAAA